MTNFTFSPWGGPTRREAWLAIRSTLTDGPLPRSDVRQAAINAGMLDAPAFRRLINGALAAEALIQNGKYTSKTGRDTRTYELGPAANGPLWGHDPGHATHPSAKKRPDALTLRVEKLETFARKAAERIKELESIEKRYVAMAEAIGELPTREDVFNEQG